jgi:class 3 adenylate cyclase
MLRNLGYRVLEASTHSKALSLIDTEEIDGFLFDIDLGSGGDGIELCRQVRTRERHQVTPVLFITGGDERSHLTPALDAGGDDFIAKPFVAALVEVRLRRHIQRTQYFHEIQRMRRLLSRYVSPATARLVEKSLSVGEATEPRVLEVSVCFTDIRGFTALSEELDPLTLFLSLNQHLSEQLNRIHEFQGYVDKFGGDGLMAVFENPGHEVQSCLCALSVVDGIRENRNFDQRITELGIGIHTGRAIVGNIGTSERLEHTAIGSTVNLASRLCEVAEPTSVVVSSDIRAAAEGHPQLEFHSEREVTIRGLKNPVTVHSLRRRRA